FDGSQVRLFADSEVRLSAMRTGRFDQRGTRLGLHLFKGPAYFNVSGNLPETAPAVGLGDALVKLSRGEFLLWAAPERQQLSVYQGQADLVEDGRSLTLQADQRALFAPQHGLHGPLPLEENLLQNSDFSRGFEGWKPLDDLEVKNDTLGQRQLVGVDINGERSTALLLSRTTTLDRHNKTGVIQDINRDVR